jgi:hypothetical protein
LNSPRFTLTSTKSETTIPSSVAVTTDTEISLPFH